MYTESATLRRTFRMNCSRCLVAYATVSLLAIIPGLDTGIIITIKPYYSASSFADFPDKYKSMICCLNSSEYRLPLWAIVKHILSLLLILMCRTFRVH